MTVANGDNQLGTYLKDRRTKLDPAALGFSLRRRRTPGLRREEVAQRANVSATWYTWLEQGRGGSPSADVLDRLARALMLTDDEREHLFLIGLGRPPEVRYHATEVTPRLQRVLDSLPLTPAFIRTATWDVVAWNHASTAIADYAAIPPEQRNSLRLLFLDRERRAQLPNWESDARFVVAAFRADVARTGAASKVQPLIDDLSRRSPEFAAMWRDHDVRSSYGEKPKIMLRPRVGRIELEYSSFAVDGRPDLSMVVYTPITPADADKIRTLLTNPAAPRSGRGSV